MVQANGLYPIWNSCFPKYLEYLQISQVMTDLLTPVVIKVPGFYFKGLTALVNKPPNMQIFASSKFGINQSTGLKVMIKNFICTQNKLFGHKY